MCSEKENNKINQQKGIQETSILILQLFCTFEITGQTWWHKPVNPTLGRMRQEDCYKFEANLSYRGSSKGYKAKPCLSKQNKKYFKTRFPKLYITIRWSNKWGEIADGVGTSQLSLYLWFLEKNSPGKNFLYLLQSTHTVLFYVMT